MTNTQVFGNIPKGCATPHKKQFKPVPAWKFVQPDQTSHKVEHDPTLYSAVLSNVDLDSLQNDLNGGEANISVEEDISVDLPITPLDASTQPASFGTRRSALDLLGSDGKGGNGVGVIILDVGLNRNYVGRENYGGGWTSLPVEDADLGYYQDPHHRAADGHGNMIARNIQSIAPDVTLYDVPILPPRVLSMQGFAGGVVGALKGIEKVIINAENDPDYPQHDHWILVNAWAVSTSFADRAHPHSYASSRAHRLNCRIIALADMDNVDVVFAAGNSGAFAPTRFSGPYDRGFENSIWGANGLEEVFTIGAVRIDGMPIGSSSQGPSSSSLTADGGINQKPDFCMPSWFVEDGDASVLNSGTSTSVALFAGLLAKLRADGEVGTSADMKVMLRGRENWTAQLGYGLPRTS